MFGLFLVSASVAADGHPPEVAKYIERCEICEHFRQEPWPEGSTVDDKERREFLVSQFERYCKGTDKCYWRTKEKVQEQPGGN
jgi:alpha-D-ribose 1-methylphosphonate 5-phosphate C-P lyase